MELFFLLLLVVIMATALGSGYPVAFALPGAAIISIGLAALAGYAFEGNTDAYFHSGGPQQWLTAGVTNLRGVYWEVERDTLIAIPLFIFMGIMLQRSKIAEDLLVTMAQLFGPVPGGLGISVVFVGALLAATTGIVGATVVAMGMISLPAMLRSNYSQSLATGTIAASGTLGQIIPPSIVLIILADQLASAADQASTLRKSLHKDATGELSMPSIFDVSGTSAGEMFLGALIPGLVLVGIYMIYILVYAILKPKAAPAVHDKDQKFNLAFWGRVTLTLVPPLALIFLVLGSIIGGIATVNQAGAIGAAGALIMASYRLPTEGSRGLFLPAIIAIVSLVAIGFALANFEMNVKAMDESADSIGIAIGAVATVGLLVALIMSAFRAIRIDNTLQQVMLETAKTTSLVFIILLGAAMLTAAFRGFGGEELVREFLNGLPGGFWTQFVIVMAVIFVLGFFLDFIEIAVVVVPIVAPILLSDPGANVTAVWLGVMIGLNMQTSFLTPPFGFALFYLRGVAPAVVKTLQIYKGVIPFIVLQLVALGIVGLYPPLVNYLPNRVSFLSETAPPPRNPKLQLCLEDYVADRLASTSVTQDAIETGRMVDLSALPEDLAEDFTSGLDAADEAIAQIEAIAETDAAVNAAAGEYRPQLTLVRGLEKQIRRLREERDVAATTLSRIGGDSERAPALEEEIAHIDEEIATLEAQIPADWDEVHDRFAELTSAEDAARNQYRRAADDAYSGPAEVYAVLGDNAAFMALEGPLADVRSLIENGQGEADAAEIENVEDLIGEVEGAGDVKSALASARREIDEDEVDREAAVADYEEALEEYAAQKQWRMDAEGALPGIRTYVEGVKGTFGIRTQDRFTRAQALAMARCTANHRDVSLNF
ncbi:TRAP transporter large permease [Maritimibacter dapengensis]|uniref:TRAP transporter large permease subunit n=1 Tax=Maritimibacter dapengensis TaxID=2836868 RepID=A0ABS6T4G7_9RHOB|nr:TRAP transporter large permease subunit [Maritimibacter dapengensis]MBV7380140.1 TRAP transporter large permease subunit [Maritimibacter dapengensis]